MGLAQGLDTLLDCAQICQRDLPQAVFTFVGGGVERERLMQEADDRKLNNVVFLPPRPMERMGELYAAADALVVHLKDDPLFRITVPSKTQAYLFVGKPIIMAMRGDAADLIRKAGAGIICEPENAKDIVGAVKNLYNMSTGERRKMGSAGRRFYLDSLSFEKGTSKFEMIMKDITSKNIHGAEFEKNI